MEFTKPSSAVYIRTVILVLVFNHANGFAQDIDDVAIVMKLEKEITSDIFETWDLFVHDNQLSDDGPNEHLFVKQNEKLVMGKLSLIADKINAFEANENIYNAVLFANVIRKVRTEGRLSNHLWELDGQIRRVLRLYRRFYEYSKSLERYEEATLAGFAWESVSASDGIPECLEVIHSLIVPDQNGFVNENILELLNESLENRYTAICETNQSPQQSLYNLYNTIAVTEIKGYAIMQFSWLLLKINGQGNFTAEMEQNNARYKIKMAKTLEAVRTAMASASQDLWRCDSFGFTNYTEITHLVQGLIANEVDLNEGGSCTQNCAHYKYARAYSCYDEDHCYALRKCNGRVYNCQFIDSDMSVCPAGENSGRRYVYIKYDNEQEFGKKQTCSRGSTTINSWHRWFVHCSYCFCFCDDDIALSERYFNLREVVTDLEENKVITGLKFVKKDKVIHLQIEQGELIERGRIGNRTEWKPVDAYSPLHYNVINGVDYLKLNWDKRYMDLDELTAPPGYLLTGVRFRTLGYHLNLEIRSTPFNFATGVLVKNLEESKWHGNDNTDAKWNNPRRMITLSEPDRSTNSKLPSIPNFESNRYVKFVPTDVTKDAAQSTVPFIDTQSVVPHPRIPIAGAGIYHKGRPGFGGFIAPKLKTYNFAPHLHIGKPTRNPIVTIRDNVVGTPHFV